MFLYIMDFTIFRFYFIRSQNNSAFFSINKCLFKTLERVKWNFKTCWEVTEKNNYPDSVRCLQTKDLSFLAKRSRLVIVFLSCFPKNASSDLVNFSDLINDDFLKKITRHFFGRHFRSWAIKDCMIYFFCLFAIFLKK